MTSPSTFSTRTSCLDCCVLVQGDYYYYRRHYYYYYWDDIENWRMVIDRRDEHVLTLTDHSSIILQHWRLVPTAMPSSGPLLWLFRPRVRLLLLVASAPHRHSIDELEPPLNRRDRYWCRHLAEFFWCHLKHNRLLSL